MHMSHVHAHVRVLGSWLQRCGAGFCGRVVPFPACGAFSDQPLAAHLAYSRAGGRARREGKPTSGRRHLGLRVCGVCGGG